MIPLAPVSKKNSQRIAMNNTTGKPFIMQSAAYTEYERSAAYFLRPKPQKPIGTPVTVRCRFYMPTKRRVDTANLVAAIHDILVKYGVLEDDNRNVIASTDGTRTLYDKQKPRTEIEIEPYEEDYDVWKS